MKRRIYEWLKDKLREESQKFVIRCENTESREDFNHEEIVEMNKKIIIILGICLVAIACVKEITGRDNYVRVMAMYGDYKTEFPDVPEVLVEELVEKQKNQNVVLVDNRDSDEIEVSMIPGAITGEEFLSNVEDYNDDSIVIAYCTIGSRSGLFAKRLQGKKVYNLRGGVLAWAHAGKTFIDSQGKQTIRVHVYGPQWDLLPEGYKAIW